MAKVNKIKITLLIPEVKIKEEITEWYSVCVEPDCGKKTKCAEHLVLNCPYCGGFVMVLPCPIEVK